MLIIIRFTAFENSKDIFSEIETAVLFMIGRVKNQKSYFRFFMYYCKQSKHKKELPYH